MLLFKEKFPWYQSPTFHESPRGLGTWDRCGTSKPVCYCGCANEALFVVLYQSILSLLAPSLWWIPPNQFFLKCKWNTNNFPLLYNMFYNELGEVYWLKSHVRTTRTKKRENFEKSKLAKLISMLISDRKRLQCIHLICLE